MLFAVCVTIIIMIIESITNIAPTNSTNQKCFYGVVISDNYEKRTIYNQEHENKNYSIDTGIFYFNEIQSLEIEKQIKENNIWSKEKFTDNYINKFQQNIQEFDSSKTQNVYYYLVELGVNNYLESKREELDNRNPDWFHAVIYDDDNNILYYYYENFEGGK